MKPFHRIFLALVIAAWTSIAPDTQAQRRGRGVSEGTVLGWPNALTLESRSSLPKVVVAPGSGGRVVFYGIGSDNILWANPDAAGTSTGSADRALGGFQCDIGPEIAGLAPHPELLAAPYNWSSRRNYLVTLESPRSDTLQVELAKEIQFDPNSGDVGFVHRIKNLSDRDAAFSLWHRIACQPGGFVLIPLNEQSRFPGRWSVLRQSGDSRRYDGEQPEAAGVQVIENILVAQTGSGSVQLGADANAQWVAYVLGRRLFVVHFPVYASAVYSESGNTVTVTWNDRWTELQPYGPEARIRSRRTHEFPMKWAIIELPAEVQTHAAARALASQIPSSPFL